MPAVAPDKWGSIGSAPTGLTEDRWVKSVEVREVNDIPRSQGTKTVGGRYVFHHMTYESSVPGTPGGTSWPIHEIGRNADEFPETAGRLLAANSVLDLNASHIHANGHDTNAHLEFGFTFFPQGYQPLYKRSPYAARQRQRPRRQAEHRPTRRSTPTRRCRSTPRSSPSSRTCTRRACACASRRSGA